MLRRRRDAALPTLKSSLLSREPVAQAQEEAVPHIPLLADEALRAHLRAAIDALLEAQLEEGKHPRLSYRALGRLISRVDRSNTNVGKGRAVAAALELAPELIAEKEKQCVWTEGRFDDLEHLADLVEDATTDYEFDTFLLGTKVPTDVQDREARVQESLGPYAEHFEPLKTELNRELGALLVHRWRKVPLVAPFLQEQNAVDTAMKDGPASEALYRDGAAARSAAQANDRVGRDETDAGMAPQGSISEERPVGAADTEPRPQRQHGRRVDFDAPEMMILVDPYFDTVKLQPAAVYLRGRYCKFDRTIPQTRWPCRKCRGTGCQACDKTGLQYPTSVEAEIAEPVVAAFGAKSESFHGMGREDIDALMLGSGRPFVLELKEPRYRIPRYKDERSTLESLVATVNKRAFPRVQVHELVFATKEEVAELKESAADKVYRAHVVADEALARDAIEAAIERITSEPLEQRTPDRVSHRRADLVRRRSVRSVQIISFGQHTRDPLEQVEVVQDPRHVTLEIVAESGTYIKELVSGDEGRTQPSFAGLLEVPMRVAALDVIGVAGFGR